MADFDSPLARPVDLSALLPPRPSYAPLPTALPSDAPPPPAAFLPTYAPPPAADGSAPIEGPWIERSVKSSLYDFGSAVPGLAGVVGNAVSPGLGDGLLRTASGMQRRAEALNPAPKWDDVHGLGDAAEYGANALIHTIPDLALAAVTGGGGGALARRGAQAAIKALAEDATKELGAKALARAAVKPGLEGIVSSEAAQAAMEQQVAPQAARLARAVAQPALDAATTTGRALGTGAGFYPSTVAGQADEAVGKDRATQLKVLAGAAPIALVAGMPEFRGFTRLGDVLAGDVAKGVAAKGASAEAAQAAGAGAQKAIQDNAQRFLPKVLKEMGTQAAIGGGTGALQTAMTLGLHKWIGDNVDMLSPDAIHQYVESAATGAGLGAAFGSVIGAAHGVPALRLRERASDFTGAVAERAEQARQYGADQINRARGAYDDWRGGGAPPDDGSPSGGPPSGGPQPGAPDAASTAPMYNATAAFKDNLAQVDGTADAFEQGHADAIVPQPRNEAANPYPLGSALQDKLATFLPRDSALWKYPQALKTTMGSVERYLGFGDAPASDNDIRHLESLHEIAPEIVDTWRKAGQALQAAGVQVRRAARDDVPGDTPRVGAEDADGVSQARTAPVENDPAAEDSESDAYADPDAAYEDGQALNEDAAGYGPGRLHESTGAVVPDDLSRMNLDQLASHVATLHSGALRTGDDGASRPYTDAEKAEAQQALRERLIGTREWAQGERGKYVKSTNNDVTVGNSPALYAQKLKTGFEIASDAPNGKPVVLDLENLVSKYMKHPDVRLQNAGKPREQAALMQLMADLHTAGVEIKPESIKAGVQYAQGAKLTPNQARELRGVAATPKVAKQVLDAQTSEARRRAIKGSLAPEAVEAQRGAGIEREAEQDAKRDDPYFGEETRGGPQASIDDEGNATDVASSHEVNDSTDRAPQQEVAFEAADEAQRLKARVPPPGAPSADSRPATVADAVRQARQAAQRDLYTARKQRGQAEPSSEELNRAADDAARRAAERFPKQRAEPVTSDSLIASHDAAQPYEGLLDYAAGKNTAAARAVAKQKGETVAPKPGADTSPEHPMATPAGRRARRLEVGRDIGRAQIEREYAQGVMSDRRRTATLRRLDGDDALALRYLQRAARGEYDSVHVTEAAADTAKALKGDGADWRGASDRLTESRVPDAETIRNRTAARDKAEDRVSGKKKADETLGDLHSPTSGPRYVHPLEHMDEAQQSAKTKADYERRVDDLYAGRPHSVAEGAKVLDRSDVLTMLTGRDLPVHLDESKVAEHSRFEHGLSADDMKHLPQWLENPAAVFRSDKPGDPRLVVLAPETKDGAPIKIIVEPNAKSGRLDAHVVRNAYDARSGWAQIAGWIKGKLALFMDGMKSRALGTNGGSYFTALVHQARGSTKSLLARSDLFKARAARRAASDDLHSPTNAGHDDVYAAREAEADALKSDPQGHVAAEKYNELHDLLEGAAQSGEDLHTTLDVLREHATPEQNKVIDMLLQHGALKGVKLSFERDTAPHVDGLNHTAGTYSPATDTVSLSSSKYQDGAAHLDPLATTIHEAAHAATAKAIERNPAIKARLEQLLAEARAKTPDDSHYGLSTIHEMVAEAYGSARFRDHLRSLPSAAGGSVWKQFVATIANALGFKGARQRNLLRDVLEAGHAASYERGVELAKGAQTEGARAGAAPAQTATTSEAPQTAPRIIDTTKRLVKDSMSPQTRNILDRALTKGHMTQLLTKIYADDPAARRAMLDAGEGMENRIAYAYKAFTEGKLKANGRELTVFNSMGENLLNLVGVAGDGTKAMRVLADIRSGDVSREGKAYDVDERVGRERGTPQRVADAAQQAWRSVVKPLNDAVLGSSAERMHSSGVPALRTLAAALYAHTGEASEGRSLVSAIPHRQATFLNQFSTAVSKLNDAEQTAYMAAMQRGESSTGSAKVDAAITASRRVFDKAFDYAKDAFPDMGKRDNYFPILFDQDASTSKIARLTTLLGDMAKQPKVEQAIRDVTGDEKTPINDLVGKMAKSAFTPYAELEPLSGDPGPAKFRAQNPRLMAFVYEHGTPEHIREFANLQTKDLNAIATRYFMPMVRDAESAKRFGKDDEALNKHLAAAKAQGATEAQLAHAQYAVDAARGRVGLDGSPILKKLLGNEMAAKLANPTSRKAIQYAQTYQNIRLLPLSLLSSIVDPMGIAVRTGGDFGTAWNGFKVGMKSLVDKQTRDEMHGMLAALGNAEEHVVSDILGRGFGANDDTGLTRWINDQVFKWNGLAGWTRATRFMALQAAHGFLLKHADGKTVTSQRYLAELGLKPGDVVRGANNRALVLDDAGRATASKTEQARDERVKNALMRFVDESILRPNSQQIPAWMSDPYMGLVAQYKAFAYALFDQIGGRISHEMDHGNARALLPALSYLPVVAASEMLRGAIQYGPGGNPQRANWGPWDYAEFAFEKSGLAGPEKQFGWEALTKPGGVQRFLGPSYEQAGEGWSALQGVASKGRFLLHSLPAEPLYSHWGAASGLAPRG